LYREMQGIGDIFRDGIARTEELLKIIEEEKAI
jgi:hypothetical protein